MIRWLLWLLAGLVLGGIVHLTTILLLPRAAPLDAYARLAPVTPVNAFTLLPEPTPERALMPFMDPAFAAAVIWFAWVSAALIWLSSSVAARSRSRCASSLRSTAC